MATSDVELCNFALTRLGHQQITSLDESTKGADLCRLHYAPTRDALLRSHPWNFAIKRATLALETATPNHEFGYQHALPSDCIKVLRTGIEAQNSADNYRIEGRKLLSDETVVNVEYIARIEDVAQFDDLFTDALAQRLAAEISVALTDNASLTKSLWDVYTMKLNEARLQDAQEGTPRDIVDTSGWLVTRA